MERSACAVIIPALNEEKTIAHVVQSLVQSVQVIVVNDGSKDKTSLYAKEAGAIVVDHSTNKGYENALNSGFQKALELNIKYVLTFDADGQHDPQIIHHFFNPLLKNEAEIVIGVRDRKARISEVIMAVFFKIKFGIDDPLCGMKAYRLTDYSRYGTFDKMKSIGTELALFVIKQGGRFIQVPVKTFPRKDKPRFGNIVHANLKIFKALFKVLYVENR